MNKKLFFNFIISLSCTFFSISQNPHPPFKFDFQDASYIVHINHEKRKVFIIKTDYNKNKVMKMMCGSGGFGKKDPNQRIWHNQLPDKSVLIINKELETISIVRNINSSIQTVSESTFLRSLHKYFKNYEPYSP